MHYTKKTLANGMRVLTVPMKDTKSLTLLVLFGTGSKYETKEHNGISHFLEHLFFKGTKSRPRAGEVNRALDDIGAEHNAFTSKELTGYWVKAASRHFSTALDIVSDILLEPLFKAEEIERERGVIFQEMSMYVDTPMRRIGEVFENLLYGDQPAGWETIGTAEALSRLGRSDFLRYWRSQYVGSNAVVIVAGSIKEREAGEAIADVFSHIKKGRAEEKKKAKEAQKSPAAKIEYKDTDQTHVIVGARGYTMYDEERFAASLLATILGGKTSSRLWQEIRERHGLAYALHAESENYTDTGYLAVYAGVPHQKLKEVVRRIAAAFKKVREGGVSQSELKRAKDFYRGHFAIGLESSDEVASFFSTQELFRKCCMTPDELLQKIDAVRVDDIEKVAHEMFRPEKVNVAVIGPHRNELELASQLVV